MKGSPLVLIPGLSFGKRSFTKEREKDVSRGTSRAWFPVAFASWLNSWVSNNVQSLLFLIGMFPWLSSGLLLWYSRFEQTHTLFLKNSSVWWVSPLLLRLFHETNEDLFWDHYPSLCVHFQFCLLVLGKKKRRRKKSHLDQVVKRSCLPRTQVIQDHVSYQAPSMFFICMA